MLVKLVIDDQCIKGGTPCSAYHCPTSLGFAKITKDDVVAGTTHQYTLLTNNKDHREIKIWHPDSLIRWIQNFDSNMPEKYSPIEVELDIPAEFLKFT